LIEYLALETYSDPPAVNVAQKNMPLHPVITERIQQPDWTQDQVFMNELRQQMIKFATLQLSDQHLAEDAVQDALVGALKNQQTFTRQAALKTWVFAILKHKIVDLLRSRSRLVSSSSLQINDDEDHVIEVWDQPFNSRGHWHLSEQPTPWQQPADSLAMDQFWLTFETCLNALPAQYSKAYMMREFVGLTTQEICLQTNTSENRLNVLLYRARMKLRNCLQENWFDKGA
jgi:RNA polymerase sigma-70 factor (ECF subfamily)